MLFHRVKREMTNNDVSILEDEFYTLYNIQIMNGTPKCVILFSFDFKKFDNNGKCLNYDRNGYISHLKSLIRIFK